jgi:hypothetical protein
MPCDGGGRLELTGLVKKKKTVDRRDDDDVGMNE